MSEKLVIIGGGPAGLSAAVSAYDNGIRDILIIERDEVLGGILNQCIHNGFGLHTFKEELTGPEYAQRYIDEVKSRNIPYLLNTMVIDIDEAKNVTYVSNKTGLNTIKADAIILCMGSRERPRGALNIAGYRPSGIYTAGTAQKLVNIDGLEIGKKIVILGSGDIGLIMARRMKLEGAEVKCVVELMPYSNGLNRNIVQCLNDFDIPLYLSHTITEIKGKERISSLVISKVDENKKVIEGSQVEYECDTLLLSCGLIPENELSTKAHVNLSKVTKGAIVDENLETNIEGIFAAGNVLHIHDLVDYVSKESALAGKKACEYLKNGHKESDKVEVKIKGGIRYVLPQLISKKISDNICLYYRTDNVYKDKCLNVYINNKKVLNNKKRIILPSQMEEIKLDIKDETINDILIALEDE